MSDGFAALSLLPVRSRIKGITSVDLLFGEHTDGLRCKRKGFPLSGRAYPSSVEFHPSRSCAGFGSRLGAAIFLYVIGSNLPGEGYFTFFYSPIRDHGGSWGHLLRVQWNHRDESRQGRVASWPNSLLMILRRRQYAACARTGPEPIPMSWEKPEPNGLEIGSLLACGRLGICRNRRRRIP